MKIGIWVKSIWKNIFGKDFVCVFCVCVEKIKTYKIIKMGVIEF